jgi:hypothetical protein
VRFLSRLIATKPYGQSLIALNVAKERLVALTSTASVTDLINTAIEKAQSCAAPEKPAYLDFLTEAIDNASSDHLPTLGTELVNWLVGNDATLAGFAAKQLEKLRETLPISARGHVASRTVAWLAGQSADAMRESAWQVITTYQKDVGKDELSFLLTALRTLIHSRDNSLQLRGLSYAQQLKDRIRGKHADDLVLNVSPLLGKGGDVARRTFGVVLDVSPNWKHNGKLYAAISECLKSLVENAANPEDKEWARELLRSEDDASQSAVE